MPGTAARQARCKSVNGYSYWLKCPASAATTKQICRPRRFRLWLRLGRTPRLRSARRRAKVERAD
eukprot:scaffold59587_cov43-Prasinocladus_malaysianus.AAC.3